MASRVVTIAAALVASTLAVSAIERKPLPAFKLMAIDGREIVSTALVRDGKWLIVYVQSGCDPCNALLSTIAATEQPMVAQRTVVVVGGANAAAVAKMAAQHADLSGIAWYADPARSMAGALPVAGAPVVFGLNKTMLEWSIAGVVPDAATMKTMLVSWTTAK